MASIQTILSDVNFGLGLLSSFGPKVDVVGIFANGAGSGAAATGGLTNSLINSIIGATGITASFGQMFSNARPLKATIRETSRVMEHPAETGIMLGDHHIINPVEIDLPMVVTAEFYAATYNQIRQAWLNATPLAVKTRVGTYSNMIIANMPREETPDMYDAIVILLQLRQVQFTLPGSNTLAQNFQPLNPLNSTTIASGLQTAVSLASQLTTAASGVASFAAVRKFL